MKTGCKFVVRMSKIAQRYQLMGVYKYATGNGWLPYNKLFLTLGGESVDDYGELLPECELATLLNEEFLRPDQYVSVENKKAIVDKNRKLKMEGPRWFQANLANFGHWAEIDKVGIINADLMVGPEKALANGLAQNLIESAPIGAIIHFNFIARNRWAESNGAAYTGGDSARSVLMSDERFARGARKMTLHYDGLYDSKSEGPGARVTRMSSLIYEKHSS